MSTYQFPTGPTLAADELHHFLEATGGDRRAFFRRAAALGLAVPAFGGLAQRAFAQETPPEDGYVGSDPQSPSTGESSPVPSKPEAFTQYDPHLPTVEAGEKDIRLVAKDATVFVAKDVPYAAWTFDGTVPGPALRVVEGPGYIGWAAVLALLGYLLIR